MAKDMRGGEEDDLLRALSVDLCFPRPIIRSSDKHSESRLCVYMVPALSSLVSPVRSLPPTRSLARPFTRWWLNGRKRRGETMAGLEIQFSNCCPCNRACRRAPQISSHLVYTPLLFLSLCLRSCQHARAVLTWEAKNVVLF